VSQGNRTFIFALLLALTVLVGWAGWFELQSWRAARDAGAAFLHARSAILAENTARAIEVADTALRSVQASQEGVNGNISAKSENYLRSLKAALPHVESLSLVDVGGTLMTGQSTALGASSLLVADRDYFQYFAQRPPGVPIADHLFIGEPTYGRLLGRWFVGMSRPLIDSRSDFAGVVLATLSVNWFHEQHQRLSQTDAISIALISQGERLIDSVQQEGAQANPPSSGMPASSVPFLNNRMWQTIFQPDSPPELLFEAVSPDGQSLGLVAVHRVANLPLAVAVSRPWDAIMGDFQRGLFRDAGLLGVVLIVLVAMWGPVSRATRDRDRLFDLSPDPVCITDTAGFFLRANPAWHRVLGYSTEELEGISHFDLVHPLDREEARRLNARLITGEAVQDVSLRYRTATGKSVWLSWSAVGEGGRVFAIARDMTRRRDAERALQKSEERFRDVAEALGEFIWEINGDGHLSYLSERARSTLGLTPAELLGKPLSTVLDTSSSDRLTQAILRGTPFVMEVIANRNTQTENLSNAVVRPDLRSNHTAQMIWLRLSGVPVVSPDGTVVGFRGAGVEITEAKMSRQALADSEARYRSIVNTVVDGIITIDERGIMQSVNPAAETIFGYSARELIGRNVSLLMSEPHRSIHDSYLSSYLSTGLRKIIGTGGREVTGQRKDGSTFPLELGVSEVYFGSQRFFIGMCRDVSERKRMERLKDEFVSTVSHELRTPLTSIRGSLGLIAGGAVGELPPKAKRLIEIAHSNCQRLVNLVNDILDIQKIEAGGMAFDMAAINLIAVAERAIEENTSYAQQYSVHVSLETDYSVIIVQGDFNRILQVVTNLLSNALKFSPPNETVIVRVILRDDQVILEVKDHGPGISTEFRPHVFEKFSQADATDTRSKGGTGLGLSISRAIAERHGGDLGFESIPGQGATFIMNLPLASPRQIQQKSLSSTSSEAPDPTQNALRGNDSTISGLQSLVMPRVLVIEDDPDVAHLMQMLLANDGFVTDVASSAAQAWDLLKNSAYAAVTMDVLLPDTDGLSLARELKRHPQYASLPVIVVSAVAQENARRLDGAALGIVDWIGKPIDEKRLREALRQSVAGASAAGRSRLRMLHVEDDPDFRETISLLFQNMADIQGAATLAEARPLLTQGHWDVVLLDLGLPDGDGNSLLTDIAHHPDRPQVVIFSGSEPTLEDARRVDAALQKSKISGEYLLQTIRQLARIRPMPDS